MFEIIMDVILDTLMDGIKILPFLFVTYLAMEYLEHKTSERTEEILQRAGLFGPVIGGVAGVVPQCGFSAAASNLYAGRVISLGSLIAVYLSTSDEMLPLMIGNRMPASVMFRILLIKGTMGVLLGLLIDFLIRRFRRAKHKKITSALRIEELCEREHCHCDDEEQGGILKSALVHTWHIFAYVLALTLVLNALIEGIGKETISAVLQGNLIVPHLIASLIGLIPNCASSIIITQLFMDGMISAGTMLSGLFVSAGVGLLILYRVNDDKKENVKITALLYLCGLFPGILFDLFKITI